MTREQVEAILKSAGLEDTKTATSELLDAFNSEKKDLKDKLENLEKDAKIKEETISGLKADNDVNKSNADKIKDMEVRLAEYEKKENERIEIEKARTVEDKIKTRFNNITKDKKFVNDYTKEALFKDFKEEVLKEENAGLSDSDLFTTITKDKNDIYKNTNNQKVNDNFNKDANINKKDVETFKDALRDAMFSKNKN